MYILCDDNGSKFSFDLGFGSRLFAWAQASKFAAASGLTVAIPSDEWVEYVMLDLPNTVVLDRNTVDNTEWKDVVLEGDFNLDSSCNWRITGACNMKTYLPTDSDVEYLQTIKFKEDKLNKFFESQKFDWGFHLRRWGGLRIPQEKIIAVLNTLPNRKIKERYYNMMLRCQFNVDPEPNDPSWICDQTYFELLDMIDGESTIYMSTDVPDYLCGYYLERYPNIVSKRQYQTDWLQLVSEYYPLKSVSIITDSHAPTGFLQSPKPEWYKTTIEDVAIDLLDFFMLTRSKYFLLSESSEWGLAAKRYASASKDNMYRITGPSDAREFGRLLKIDEPIESFDDIQLDEMLE